MSTDGDAPALDGSDLAELRTRIDELKSVPADQLITPDVATLDEVTEPEPSDAIEFDATEDASPTADVLADAARDAETARGTDAGRAASDDGSAER